MASSLADWSKGIALSVLASIIGGASKLSIRKSWLIEQQTTTKSHRSLALRRAGMLGMTILNPLCCVAAMEYASPSILAPFSGLTLVWIVAFCGPVLGEPPTSTQVQASILIVVGEVLVALFGDHQSTTVQSYAELWMVLYLVGICLWMLVLRWATQRPALRRFAWGASGGSITGMQNFLKDALTLGQEGSVHWGVIALLVTLAALTAFAGLVCLTACMKRYDATYSSAMFVGSFVVSASIMSAVHYDTFQNLPGMINYILYPAGLGVLLAGVGLLVRDSEDKKSTAAATTTAVSIEGQVRGEVHLSSCRKRSPHHHLSSPAIRLSGH